IVSPLAMVADPPRIDRSVYRTVTNLDELDAIVGLARSSGQVVLDLETSSADAMRADIVGIALAVANRPAAYVPLTHRYLGAPAQLALIDVLTRLKPLLEDAAVRKLGQNVKYDLIVLARHGINLRGPIDDTMLAAYVLDPSRLSF